MVGWVDGDGSVGRVACVVTKRKYFCRDPCQWIGIFFFNSTRQTSSLKADTYHGFVCLFVYLFFCLF